MDSSLLSWLTAQNTSECADLLRQCLLLSGNRDDVNCLRVELDTPTRVGEGKRGDKKKNKDELVAEMSSCVKSRIIQTQETIRFKSMCAEIDCRSCLAWLHSPQFGVITGKTLQERVGKMFCQGQLSCDGCDCVLRGLHTDVRHTGCIGCIKFIDFSKEKYSEACVSAQDWSTQAQT